MNRYIRIVKKVVAGGFCGVTVWAIIYTIRRTPSIEFDGPAIMGVFISAGIGMLVILAIRSIKLRKIQ